jgi:hypothetical protein
MDRRMNADAPEDGLNFARLDTDVTCGTRPAYATHLTKKPGMFSRPAAQFASLVSGGQATLVATH